MSSAPAQLSVPFLALAPMNEPVAAGVLSDVSDLLASGAFTNGPHVEAFERAFADYLDVSYCVGVASGLDALRLALQALGVTQGDEVIVPAMTFIATFEAVSQVGAVPRPVDISDTDYCLDPAAIEEALGPRTKAIMPVHLYGRISDMTRIAPIAEAHNLDVVEDACQAHGAKRDGVGAGTAGTAAAFSFYPGKNLGALGDAGALVTNDRSLADGVVALREHGQRRKYEHDSIGWTARLDTIQAAALLRKLALLETWNAQRRQVADLYSERLSGVGDLVLPDSTDRGQVWHLYVVRTADPSVLAEHLRARAIGTGRHYPEPPHLSLAYRDLGYEAGSFPVAERLANEALSLPIYPGMGEVEVDYVVEGVRTWFDGA
jgi:dTDP-4-amino-4,6-dideoxygalactose transaminase